MDEARIHVHAGDGGRGSAAFRREKFEPYGGPAGGDGGDGGDVVLVVDPQLATLLDFKYRREYRAGRGEHGMGKDMDGARGAPCLLRVPAGTLVYDEETGELVADLAAADQRVVVARGGRGGRGNRHFATSTNRAPRRAEPGAPGQERRLRLELRLLADVGVIGMPNAGKSSFVARVSRARTKVADYPFTTKIPHLGVVRLDGERNFVIADVPGLIEGAADGAGLGHRFLRHVQRTRVLLHLVEVAEEPGRDPLADYRVVRRELAAFDPALARRPELCALNKIDRPEVRERYPGYARRFARAGVRLLALSAASGEGVRDLIERLWAEVAAGRYQASAGAAPATGTATETGAAAPSGSAPGRRRPR